MIMMKARSYVAAALLSAVVAGCVTQSDETGKESLSQSTEAVDSVLDDMQVCMYSGVVPARGEGGVRYSLTVRYPKHSGDGEFDLTLVGFDDKGKAENVVEYHGKRYTQRGMAGDNDATVWQLKAENGRIFNFLYNSTDNTLTLLNDNFEKAGTEADYTLQPVN